jgi:hypothetical protein
LKLISVNQSERIKKVFGNAELMLDFLHVFFFLVGDGTQAGWFGILDFKIQLPTEQNDSILHGALTRQKIIKTKRRDANRGENILP